MAKNQMGWDDEPVHAHFRNVILTSGFRSRPLNEIRGNIQNTKGLVERLIQALGSPQQPCTK